MGGTQTSHQMDVAASPAGLHSTANSAFDLRVGTACGDSSASCSQVMTSSDGTGVVAPNLAGSRQTFSLERRPLNMEPVSADMTPKDEESAQGRDDCSDGQTDWKSEGNRHYKAGHVQKAMSCCHLALLHADSTRDDRWQSTVWNNLALCSMAQRSFKDALHFAENATIKDSSWVKPHYIQAQALRRLGRLEEAQGSLERLLLQFPKCLEARSMLQEMKASKKESGSLDDMVWQYEDIDDKWVTMPTTISEEVDGAYWDFLYNPGQASKDAVLINYGGMQRTVVFPSMVQINCATQKVRRVRRISVSQAEPSLQSELVLQHTVSTLQERLSQTVEAEKTARAEVKRIEKTLQQVRNLLHVQNVRLFSRWPPESGTLDSTDPCFDFVSYQFTNSLRSHRKSYDSDQWCPAPEVTISRIEQLDIPWQREMYMINRARVLDKHPEGLAGINAGGAAEVQPNVHLNELFLWHGCQTGTAEAICADGFDPQRGGESAGHMFGVGTYFAAHASKSDLYASENAEGIRCVIYARVLLGSSFRQMIVCPERKRPPDLHHSLWADTKEFGGVVDYPEYVVFRHSMAVPCYIVYYKHNHHCQCRSCVV